jgi:GH35 family endo-1,4-beta-xylanase
MKTSRMLTAVAALGAAVAACGGQEGSSPELASSGILATAANGYVGCYTDTATRALPTRLAASNSTVENCIAAAKGGKFAYAGLQYGGECWAGNKPGFTLVSNAQCNMRCSANTAEICGGSWRNSIYSTTPTPTPTPTPAPATTLRDGAARHGLLFGAGWGPPPWTNSEAIASAQYNAFLLPGTVGRIWPGPGNYDWSQPDFGVQYAAAHPGFHYSSAQLFYGIFVGQNSTELVPAWLRGRDSVSGYGAPTVSPDQLSQHMHDFLRAYVQRYGTGCYRTEIANELVSSPGTDWYYQQSSIGAAGGKTVAQYVDQLARWAKAANPNVKLYLNDTRNEDSQTSMGTANAFADLVRTLKGMGTPLDGLGFQCHQRLNGGYNYASVQGVFAYFASLGYDLHITEMGITAAVNASGIVSSSDQAAQAAQFSSLVKAFVAGAGAKGKSIATWGTTDTNAFDVGGLLWDVNAQPKAGFQAVLNALNE